MGNLDRKHIAGRIRMDLASRSNGSALRVAVRIGLIQFLDGELWIDFEAFRQEENSKEFRSGGHGNNYPS